MGGKNNDDNKHPTYFFDKLTKIIYIHDLSFLSEHMIIVNYLQIGNNIQRDYNNIPVPREN